MSTHSDTFSWFRANQSLLFVLYAACLAENWFDTIYSTWGEHADHYTTDAVLNFDVRYVGYPRNASCTLN